VTEKNVVTAIRDALHGEMANDERIVLLGEDVGIRGGVFRISEGWMEEFGEQRVIDTPLAESGIVGVAIGMALHGLLPIAEIQFADFIHPAFDQILSEAARLRYRSNGDFGVPMVIRTPCGGGIHGALYHSQSIEAFYAHIPGIKVVMPSTPADAAGLLRSAIKDPDPVLFLEHKKTYRSIKGEVADGAYLTPIGVADVKREGDDLTCVSYGYALHTCLDAARRLEEDEDVSVEVVDVRTLAPLDVDTIVGSVRKTSKAMVVYEDNRTYGAGAEIASTIAEQALYDLDAPIVRIGGPDIPAMPFAAPLEHFFMEPEPAHSGTLATLGSDGVSRRQGRPQSTEAPPPPPDRGRYERPRGGCRRRQEASVAQGATRLRPQLRGPQGHHAQPIAAHGLRGGDVPQHPGMLGGARGDVPDPGNEVHPALWLLRRDDGQAGPRR
jgi:2-oxoisovalerate dehydrogenase E1 component subunit beta